MYLIIGCRSVIWRYLYHLSHILENELQKLISAAAHLELSCSMQQSSGEHICTGCPTAPPRLSWSWAGRREWLEAKLESRNHRLEKTSKIVKSNHPPNTPCLQNHIPKCHIYKFFKHLQGW